MSWHRVIPIRTEWRFHKTELVRMFPNNGQISRRDLVLPTLLPLRRIVRRRIRNERLVLGTQLDRYQCRQRLSGVRQPKPVERVDISGFGGSVNAYTFNIHEGAQRGRNDPAGTWVSGRMRRTSAGTEIDLQVDHGRWDFAIECFFLLVGLAALMVVAYSMYATPAFGDWRTYVLMMIGAAFIGVLRSWQLADRKRDDKMQNLVQLVCSTLDAEIIEMNAEVETLFRGPEQVES